MQLNEYLNHIGSALSTKDGKALSDLLSLTRLRVDVDLSNVTPDKIEHQCQIQLAQQFPGFSEVVANSVKARQFLIQQASTEAYNAQIAGVIKFMEVFRGETNWVLPFLHTLTYDTRMVATKADEDASAKAGEELHDNLRGAEQHLKKGFSMAANDRAPPEHSKKLGALFVVNQLFKIYFKLNTIHLCRNLIRAVEGPAFPAFEKFGKADKVTYQYYVGRLSMFEDNYHKAETCLDYAWRHCHSEKHRNKRMILQFLVPVKMLLGVMPSPHLMEQYSLDEYNGLTEATRTGDLKGFNEYLSKYQDRFIQQGVYLLIEKLRLVVHRNLLKKVYLIRQSHQLRLEDFQIALSTVTGEDMDMTQVECLVTNLIFKGYLKGYMSHQKKMLVLEKEKMWHTNGDDHLCSRSK